MADPCETVYRPRSEAKEVYDRLYSEYLTLHDYFGRGGNDVMKRLKEISAEVKSSK
jgi:L-ribulokinase